MNLNWGVVLIYRARVFGLGDSLMTNPVELRHAPVFQGEALVAAANAQDINEAAASAWIKVVGIERGIALDKMGAPENVRRAVTEPSSSNGDSLVCISARQCDELQCDYEFIYNNRVEMWLICLSATQNEGC